MMPITVTEKVLIAGGVLNLVYGALLGYPITVIRVKGTPATPKYLMAAHVSTLLHAAVLLGLAWATQLATLGPGWQDAGFGGERRAPVTAVLADRPVICSAATLR